MMRRSHPDIPHLCDIRIDLFLKYLPRFTSIRLNVINDLQAFSIFFIFEHDHLYFLTWIIHP